MDLFGKSDGLPDPPTCLITVTATPGPNTRSTINYGIPVEGVVSDTESIYIIRTLESSSSSLHVPTGINTSLVMT